jgi:uncharacterized protein (TIGR00730 family)
MSSLCVFCGSSPGARPEYADAARELAEEMAARGIGLVYGAGRVGLMGVLADAMLSAGGDVVGVIPQALVDREVAHQGLTELEIVDSMHERKRRMAERSDAFVALPGGIGTLEELFEVFTWAQLGIHAKPCGLLDVAGYYRPLREMLDRMVGERFLRPRNRELLVVAETPAELLDRLASHHPPPVEKWLDRLSLDES